MCVSMCVHLVFVERVVEVVNRSGTDSFSKRVRIEVSLLDWGK